MYGRNAAMVRYVLQKALDVRFDNLLESALEGCDREGVSQDVMRVLLEAGVKVRNMLDATCIPANIVVLRGLAKEHMVRALRKIYEIHDEDEANTVYTSACNIVYARFHK